MIYNVEFIARFNYTVNADNIGEAENAGYMALKNDDNNTGGIKTCILTTA